jgi:hypothetical protein
MYAGDPYDLEALRYDPETGGYVRKDPESVLAQPAEAH